MSGDTRRLIRALAALVLIVVAVLVLIGVLDPTTRLTWACFLAAGVGLLTTT